MRADRYFSQSNMVDACPLYEHLAAQSPESVRYAERLAFCLVGRAEGLPDGEQRTQTMARARTAAERAKSLGDNSNLLTLILDRVGNPTAARKLSDPRLDVAEAAFGRGDLDAALAAYQQVAADDKTSYEARVYAGDVYFRKHDTARAAEWFQRAIDVDPDRETAYRYWGDALMQDGDTDGALQKFIDAVVAEPYGRPANLALQQWAQRTGATIEAPAVRVPDAPTVQLEGGKPKVEITLNEVALRGDANAAAAAWLVYATNRALWREEKFAAQFPHEQTYRHSLAEEVESLALALVAEVFAQMKEAEEPTDPSLREVARLAEDGMLEPFVLLSGADEGIAQDYAAYRRQHRDVLRAYIARYLVHRGAVAH